MSRLRWALVHAAIVAVLLVGSFFNGLFVVALAIHVLMTTGWGIQLLRARSEQTQRRAMLVRQYRDEAWAAEQVRRMEE